MQLWWLREHGLAHTLPLQVSSSRKAPGGSASCGGGEAWAAGKGWGHGWAY